MKWHVNPKKSGDGGIDGWTDDRKKIPIQIKNSKVTSSVVRDLAGVCNASSFKMGIIVGWGFSKDCHEFVAGLKRKTKTKIELNPANKIVKPIDSMDKKNWNKLYRARVIESKRKPQYTDTTLGGQQNLFKKVA